MNLNINDNKFNTNLYHEFNIKKSKPINIIITLQKRELGHGRLYQNETNFSLVKRIYLSIFPNLTIINVKFPNCYLRKFTPNGQYLIAYNQNLCGIHIYKYQSCTKIFEYLEKHYKSHKFSDKCDHNRIEYENLRENVFDLFFKEIKNLKLTSNQDQSTNSELINREFSLFYDTNYLILASSEIVNEDQLPSYEQLTENNESVHLNPIENYTFYLINITETRVCDRLKFKNDKILLTHNNGVHMYKNVITILSQQNQTIYVYRILDRYDDHNYEQKYFQITHKIGRFCYEDDENYIKSTLGSIDKPFTENIFTGMKHRILTFFYKEAIEKRELNRFYMFYNTLMNLRMQKHQLLDDQHMIIKYVHLDNLINQPKPQTSITITTPNDPFASQFYFVLYNFVNSTVLNIFPSNSLTLFYAYENLNDFFTLCSVDYQYNYHTIASNNEYARQTLQRYIKNISKINSKNEMIKCMLAQLPISAQSYTLTPYLDHSLFSYDEKIISNFDRPKAIGDQVVRFNFRENGHLAFRLYPGLQSAQTNPQPIQNINNAFNMNNQNPQQQQQPNMVNNNNNNSNEPININTNSIAYRRLVAFIWHPYEPFCISVQRATYEYNVNFHIYVK